MRREGAARTGLCRPSSGVWFYGANSGIKAAVRNAGSTTRRRRVEGPMSESKGLWQSVKGMFAKPKKEEVPRATRYPYEGPLRFRPGGQGEWYQGVMFNISETGVVFRSLQTMDVKSPVELNFVMPPEIAGKEGAVVFCKGDVVRAAMPKTDDNRPLIAATIVEYLPGSQWKPAPPPPAETAPEPPEADQKPQK